MYHETPWTPSEIMRRDHVLAGQTVTAHMKRDAALIAWAKANNLYVPIDRRTDWGNPFVIPAAGTREQVIDQYRWYLAERPVMLRQLPSLAGKVLGCWCYPHPCHGDVLIEFMEVTCLT